MTVQVRAHFDRKVIVPDEPVDVPVNEPLMVQISVAQVRQATEAELDAAFERLKAMGVPNANISDDALTSEGLYGDED